MYCCRKKIIKFLLAKTIRYYWLTFTCAGYQSAVYCFCRSLYDGVHQSLLVQNVGSERVFYMTRDDALPVCLQRPRSVHESIDRQTQRAFKRYFCSYQSFKSHKKFRLISFWTSLNHFSVQCRVHNLLFHAWSPWQKCCFRISWQELSTVFRSVLRFWKADHRRLIWLRYTRPIPVSWIGWMTTRPALRCTTHHFRPLSHFEKMSHIFISHI